MDIKNKSISVVSVAHRKSYLKKRTVKARIMCCFGVLEKANLSSFKEHTVITSGPKLKINKTFEPSHRKTNIVDSA